MKTTYTKYLEELLKVKKKERDRSIEDATLETEEKKKSAEASYRGELQALENEKNEAIDQELVRERIRERKLQEALGNMGLTDSGLSRTEVSANKLLTGNNVSAIRSRTAQNADKLKEKLDEYLASLNRAQNDAIAKAEQKYDELELKQLEKADSQSDTAKRDKAWNEIISAIYNAEVPTKKRDLLIADFVRQYGMDENEKNVLKRANVIVDQIVNTQTPEKTDSITPSRKAELDKLFTSGVISRKEYLKEKQITPEMPDYRLVIQPTLTRWVNEGRISREEYAYLVNKYDGREG